MEAMVEVTRSGRVECVHYGDIAVCDMSGTLVATLGDPERRVFWRSSAKPIQALAVVHTGAADRFGLTAKELAVCCGSHSGSAEHVATVRGMLAKLGLDERALQCGTHWPQDGEEDKRLLRSGHQPSPLHNNCSGKHAGMLASALALGADLATYLDIGHPVQEAILQDMAALCSVPPEAIERGVDGCGAPTHLASLREMATAFARLARPEGLPPRLQTAAQQIAAAMAAEPVMVSARGGFGTDILVAGQGNIIAKGGAEGLFVLGLADRGLGLAIRSVDGSHRGQHAAILRALKQLGALAPEVAEALTSYRVAPVLNCHGAQVGEVRAAEFNLQIAASRGHRLT